MSAEIERAKAALFHCTARILRLRDEIAVLQSSLDEALRTQEQLTQRIKDDYESLAD